MHRDLMDCVTQMKSDITEVGNRVNHVQHKMAEFSTAHNDLVDANNEKEDELELLRCKMADLEDRSHRNNVKLCRVAKTVPPVELYQFVQQLITF